MDPTQAKTLLRPVDKDNLRQILRLKVAPEQEDLVASNAISIAQAHYSESAWFRAIYSEETPVGFVMLSLEPAKPEYYLWRFMIDDAFQGRGLGRRALEAVIDHVRSLPDAEELLLSVAEAPHSAVGFYEQMGFRLTGEVEEGELVMSLKL